MRTKAMAEVHIYNAAKMTKQQRRDVADWLKQHAADIIKDADEYDARFKGRIFR